MTISEEARQLLRRARERGPAEEEAPVSPLALRAPFPFDDQADEQVIAVRVGPIPLEDIPRPAAESRAADALSERAFRREFDRVLTLPDRSAANERTDEETAAELLLLGAERDESVRERPAIARNEPEVDAPRSEGSSAARRAPA